MTSSKKQPKINKFLQRIILSKAKEIPADCEELVEEIQQLRELLKEKKDELFQLQRNSIKVGDSGLRQKSESLMKKDEVFVRPEKIVLTNSKISLKHDLDLMSMITGTEVQSYVPNDHCVIVYHMQHDALHEIKHGLRIDMRSGTNTVSESSLPYGFNLTAVLDNFSNVMLPECLGAIRKALVAYYDRLTQFDALKNLLNIDAQLIKNVDGTHMEVMFKARSALEAPDSELPVAVMLHYRLHDIRPKQCTIVEIDIPEAAVTALKSQLVYFEKTCLTEAFKDAFMDGIGPYLIIKEFDVEPASHQPRRRKRKHQNPYNKNDDTFRPEDCSQSEEEHDE